MKGFFQKIGEGLRRFAQGRYGQDEMGFFLNILALILVMLTWVPGMSFMVIPAMALLIWALFRCYSRNIPARQAERAAYLRLRGKFTGFFALQKRKWTDRKQFRYFRCKQCGAVFRVPKGKGEVKVTCPKCHSQTTTKT